MRLQRTLYLQNGICITGQVLTVSEAISRHCHVYYHLTNLYTEGQVDEEGSRNYNEYADDVSQLIVGQMEDILGYIFRHKNGSQLTHNESNELQDNVPDDDDDYYNEIRPRNRNSVPQNPTFSKRLFRCSQDVSLANYSTYDKSSTVLRRKRRRQTIEQWYACAGALHLWIPNNLNGAMIQLALGTINLSHGEVLLHFRHKCPHPPRERKPVPKVIQDFIKNPDNACRSTFEMSKKIHNAAKGGKFDNVVMADITEDNVRYWLLESQKNDYMRHHDAWQSAVTLLQEQQDVTVHSYIDRRRRYFCWYFLKLFNIDLANVTEIYVDSTHLTNGQNAELFAIIACENGYSIPVGYMLMEKKSTDDSKKYPGEVIEACAQFFRHAKELGLYPIIVHTDKSAAEIAAVKVHMNSFYLTDIQSV